MQYVCFEQYILLFYIIDLGGFGCNYGGIWKVRNFVSLGLSCCSEYRGLEIYL